jgi:hypothetical protein
VKTAEDAKDAEKEIPKILGVLSVLCGDGLVLS